MVLSDEPEVKMASKRESKRPAGDLPSKHDLLGYKPYAEVMAEMLQDETLETPYTIGIYGPWGTGKSTFMHLLGESLGVRHEPPHKPPPKRRTSGANSRPSRGECRPPPAPR